MELQDSKRIFFDELSHSYLDTERGVLLTGVTSLMKKHGLSPDYGNIPDEVLKKAADEGTAIHREIQDFENGISFFSTPLIDSYLELVKENGLKFVASEYKVTDYELVASAIDIVYEAEKGAFLLDIKTTQDYHRRALEWQLGIYKDFFERMNPTIPVVGCGCLWIDKKTRKIKGLIPVNPVSEDEVNALLDCERSGRIYIDTGATPDLEEILPHDDAAVLAEHAGRIVELENTLKILKDADEEIRARLLAYMESNNLNEVACEGGVFKRKASYTSERADTKKLKSLFPAVYEKVKTTSTTKASLTFKPNK